MLEDKYAKYWRKLEITVAQYPAKLHSIDQPEGCQPQKEAMITRSL
jgi:hypothetical protein